MKFKFIIYCLLFCNFINAQNPGDYDSSFGTNGRVTFAHAQTSITPSDMLIQPDGKILAVVRQSLSVPNTGFIVTRLLANGSLDTTFGINGSTVIDFSAYEDRPYSIALQSDGKILVGGTTVPFSGSTTDIAIARLNPDGSLDTTFGTGGKTTFFFGLGSDILQKLIVEPNQKYFDLQ